eukprot:TRINITY_DN2724_c0_g1_i1.p1 TRINITY_DN2724_c0_g1~~TRINITY_DN2724_c0_g1_i1.p1  ORF type:complete len:106 (-),score=37.66 TRINITY_DN2724_c0_g1_i1:68-385(-)
MTQKNLLKGKKKPGKGKEEAANRHGKPLRTRKGKQVKPPKKKTDELAAMKELSQFINEKNEKNAAALAMKQGAPLKFVQAPPDGEVIGKKAKKKKRDRHLPKEME